MKRPKPAPAQQWVTKYGRLLVLVAPYNRRGDWVAIAPEEIPLVREIVLRWSFKDLDWQFGGYVPWLKDTGTGLPFRKD